MHPTKLIAALAGSLLVLALSFSALANVEGAEGVFYSVERFAKAVRGDGKSLSNSSGGLDGAVVGPTSIQSA